MLMNTFAKLTFNLAAFVLTFSLLGACTKSNQENTFAPTNPSPTNSSPASAWMDGIIGGTPVTADDLIAKSVGLLLNRTVSRGVCTVAILSNEYAITAAHCVENYPPQALFVAFGNEFRRTTPIRAVIMAAPHERRPGREGQLFEQRDLALVKFSGGLPPGFQPVAALPFEYFSALKPGTPVTIAGYGVDKFDPNTPTSELHIDTLRKTELKVWNPVFSETEILLDQRNGKAACRGDSGGPAFVFINGKMYFWGIASRGVLEDGQAAYPDECAHFVVYTNAIKLLNSLSKLRNPNIR
jgi:hypothetical protein